MYQNILNTAKEIKRKRKPRIILSFVMTTHPFYYGDEFILPMIKYDYLLYNHFISLKSCIKQTTQSLALKIKSKDQDQDTKK